MNATVFAVRVPPGTELANLEPPKNKGWSPIPIGSVLKMPDHSLLPGTKQFVRSGGQQAGDHQNVDRFQSETFAKQKA